MQICAAGYIVAGIITLYYADIAYNNVKKFIYSSWMSCRHWLAKQLNINTPKSTKKPTKAAKNKKT